MDYLKKMFVTGYKEIFDLGCGTRCVHTTVGNFAFIFNRITGFLKT